MRMIDADYLKTWFGEKVLYGYDYIIGTIDDAPTVEPEPQLWKLVYEAGKRDAEPERKKGTWIDDGTELGCCCSECGVTLDDYFDGALYEVRLGKMPKFCPSCGSYNGGEEDEVD